MIALVCEEGGEGRKRFKRDEESPGEKGKIRGRRDRGGGASLSPFLPEGEKKRGDRSLFPGRRKKGGKDGDSYL